ncbi:hypothetical protein [Streptomyces scabiei]|uniref:hypothetical protein n=1 Tax=Streptomyces scabiei TaxID=1930 RepID=UPI0029BC53FB|nr:hypothetical protein [Streptomyces scabiei]MDX3522381.1 hypothetical protein [Streptomyces scabiei]
MTRQQTMQELPITLGLPLDDPTPPDDCEGCARLVQQRAAAKRAGDLSRVSDLNVAIRAHHLPRRKTRR